MKKKTPYLNFYYKCIEKGEIPYRVAEKTSGGLCSIFGKRRVFKLITPHEGTTANNDSWYWGYSVDGDTSWQYHLGHKDTSFTELRQTLVLLMAALNNEL